MIGAVGLHTVDAPGEAADRFTPGNAANEMEEARIVENEVKQMDSAIRSDDRQIAGELTRLRIDVPRRTESGIGDFVEKMPQHGSGQEPREVQRVSRREFPVKAG